MRRPGPYDDSEYRATLATTQEVAMHPQIIAWAAAERVKDMQADANRTRRARAARRARRGVIAITAAGRPVQVAAQALSPQPPCPELTARAA